MSFDGWQCFYILLNFYVTFIYLIYSTVLMFHVFIPIYMKLLLCHLYFVISHWDVYFLWCCRIYLYPLLQLHCFVLIYGLFKIIVWSNSCMVITYMVNCFIYVLILSFKKLVVSFSFCFFWISIQARLRLYNMFNIDCKILLISRFIRKLKKEEKGNHLA